MKVNGINITNTVFMSSKKQAATTGVKILAAAAAGKGAKDLFEKSHPSNMQYDELEDDNDSSTFRDRELFDPYLDNELDIEYSQYDEDDIPVPTLLASPLDYKVQHKVSKILDNL